jgi:hypothetical protein
MRTLAAHRQIAAMTTAAVAAEIDQALDVELHVAAQIAFDAEVRFDRVTDLADVVLVEIVGPLVRRDSRRGQDDVRRVTTEAINISMRLLRGRSTPAMRAILPL